MPNHDRPSSRKLPAARVRELKRIALKIDREEGAAIRANGRVLRRRHDLLRNIVQALRGERQRLGLTLAEVGERSGIGRANLSRLENEPHPNPTIDTLMRYAAALDKEIHINIADTAPKRQAS